MNPYASVYKQESSARREYARKRGIGIFALAAIVTVLVSFAVVSKRTYGQQLVFEVKELEDLCEELKTENSVLLGRKQTLMTRDRIGEIAQKRLNLQYPKDGQVHWIKITESGITKVETKAGEPRK